MLCPSFFKTSALPFVPHMGHLAWTDDTSECTVVMMHPIDPTGLPDPKDRTPIGRIQYGKMPLWTGPGSPFEARMLAEAKAKKQETTQQGQEELAAFHALLVHFQEAEENHHIAVALGFKNRMDLNTEAIQDRLIINTPPFAMLIQTEPTLHPALCQEILTLPVLIDNAIRNLATIPSKDPWAKELNSAITLWLNSIKGQLTVLSAYIDESRTQFEDPKAALLLLQGYQHDVLDSKAAKKSPEKSSDRKRKAADEDGDHPKRKNGSNTESDTEWTPHSKPKPSTTASRRSLRTPSAPRTNGVVRVCTQPSYTNRALYTPIRLPEIDFFTKLTNLLRNLERFCESLQPATHNLEEAAVLCTDLYTRLEALHLSPKNIQDFRANLKQLEHPMVTLTDPFKHGILPYLQRTLNVLEASPH